MPTLRALALTVAVATAVLGAPSPAYAEGTAGTTFPPGFRVPLDLSLAVPVIGFGGADGEVRRTPVILLHGNNDTPYPTSCNGAYGAIQAFGQSLLDDGWSPKEVWALGYQGDQCDLLLDQTRRAREAHSTVANVPDLRAFVRSVLEYTGAKQVDVVGHSLGTTLTREWMRQDDAYRLVRRLVAVDGPNHGIINCSPDPQNYYATSLGFTPDSAVCREYGAADTPFLKRLNRGDETPGPTEYLVIRNVDASFVYMSKQDGVLPPVPAEDRHGRPHDFGASAKLRGAEEVQVTGAGRYDSSLQAAHTGIVNDPSVWAATRAFLKRPAKGQAAVRPAARPAAPRPAAPAPPAVATGTLPATGGGSGPALVATALLLAAAAGRRVGPRRLSRTT